MRCHKSQPGAVLEFSGEDHQQFLQGQGTADLSGNPGFCRYCLWLDFRGNVIGDGYVLKTSESRMLLVSDLSHADSLVSKFERHIIADDVEIADRTREFEMVSVPAEFHGTFLRQHGWATPAAAGFVCHNGAFLFHGRRLGKETLQALVPARSLAFTSGELLQDTEAETFRMQSSFPAIPADTDEGSLNPLEMNVISPLSFTKGCYLGQEVVARVHRLGRVSRRLAKFQSRQVQFFPGAFLHMDGSQTAKITSVVTICDNIVAIGWLKAKISNGELAFDEGRVLVESLPPS